MMMDRKLRLICFVIMVVSQMVSAGIQPILYRKAYKEGIELEILMTYTFCVGWIINLIIGVLSSEWKEWRNLTWRDVFWAFMSGILGGPFPQYLFVLSLVFASSKQASIVSTIVPCVLYVLCISFGKEKLSRSISCVAKVVGRVFVPIAAALLQGILNRGPLTVVEFAVLTPTEAPGPTPFPQPFIYISSVFEVIFGFLICLQGSSTIATWLAYYIQEKTAPKFVHTFTMAALMNFFGALSLMIYCVCRYHDREYYNLGQANTKMAVCAFTSIIISVLATSMATWCIRCKGQDYVASFSNLSLIIDTIAVPFMMEGRLQWGSVASVVLEIFGVGAFHWGKTKEAIVAASIAPAEEIQETKDVEADIKDHPAESTESRKVDVALIINGSQTLETGIEMKNIVSDDQDERIEETALHHDGGESHNMEHHGDVKCNDLRIDMINTSIMESNDQDHEVHAALVLGNQAQFLECNADEHACEVEPN